MSLTNYKLTDDAIARNGVVSAPDKLTGSAAQNKMVFDRLIREAVKGLYNSLIDTLASSAGAGEIGTAAIGDIAGGSVQSALGDIKTLLDSKSSDADMTAALALKSDKVTTNQHIKDVSFDNQTGVFTFTKEDGSFTAINTALEKVATNWRYDAATQSLVLTLLDGTTQSVFLSAFITETEFMESAYISFRIDGHRAMAVIKPGSITDSLLSSALVEQLQRYVSSAADSATEATLQARHANGFSDEAAAARSEAVTARNSAVAYAEATENFAHDAADSAEEAKEWAIGQNRDGQYVQPRNAFTYSTLAGQRASSAEASASSAADSAASAAGNAATASTSAASASDSAASAAADANRAEHYAGVAESLADLGLSVVDGRLCQTHTT